MARNIVTALPAATDSFAGSCGDELLCIAHLGPRVGIMRELACSTSESKPAIDQRRTEEPLRDEDPVRCDQPIPQHRLDSSCRQTAPKARVHQHKHDKRKSCPEPSDLNEVHIEHVLLQREVARRKLGRVRLQVS